jgi:hypothetical protein
MLKNVLSLLLSKFYSKQEAELVGHQAMPELSQYIDLTSIATANVENTYVAPTDGYFVCATKGGELSGVNVWGTLDAGVPGASGIQGKVFTPCVKGASVHYIIYGTIHLVRFYKTIGGGGQTLKKLILQGGGLCLNSLSSSLRRSSCRVRRNGSEVKVFSQTQIPEQRSLLTTLRLSFIRLQVMDGLHSAETDHRSMSALLESWERVALTLKVISELQLRFGRGIPLVSIARRTISNRLRQNSFPAKGQRNTSLVGGASC